MKLLLLARLINLLIDMLRGFVRRISKRFYCQCGRLRREVEKVVCVMSRLTTVVAMVECSLIDSINVLTMDSAMTGAQLCQNSSSLLGCVCSAVALGGGRPLGSFDELLSMAVLTASRWMLLIAELHLVSLSGSSSRYYWMSGLSRPIRYRRRSGRSSCDLWLS